MRSKKYYRDLIRKVIQNAIQLRPRCALVSSVTSDDDGFLCISFHCLNHDATWRDYVDETPDTGRSLDSPCPPSLSVDVQEHPQGMAEAAEAAEAQEEVNDHEPTKKRRRTHK